MLSFIRNYIREMRHCRLVRKFQTECENRRAHLVAYKEYLMFFRWRANTNEEKLQTR